MSLHETKTKAKTLGKSRGVGRVYKARAGSRLKDADAAVIGPACDALAAQHGVLTASIVVEAAKNRRHPLHRYMTWDDAEAGEQWRLSEARKLMGSYTVLIERNEISQDVRGLQYVSSQDGYVPSSVIFNDIDLTKEVIERAGKEAEHWYLRHQKIRALGAFPAVFDAIEEAIMAPKKAVGA